MSDLNFLVPVFFSVQAGGVGDAFRMAAEIFVDESVSSSTTVHHPIEITGMQDEEIREAVSSYFSVRSKSASGDEDGLGSLPASPVGLLDAAIGSLSALRGLCWADVKVERSRILGALEWSLGEHITPHAGGHKEGPGDGLGSEATESSEDVHGEPDGINIEMAVDDDNGGGVTDEGDGEHGDTGGGEGGEDDGGADSVPGQDGDKKE